MIRNYAIVVNLTGNMLAATLDGWDVLRKIFHIKYISSRSPCPHITLSAGSCNLNETDVVRLVKEIATDVKSFEISGNGLGVFVVETPVVYVRWLLSDKLDNLHTLVHGDMKRIWSKFETHYTQEMWLPKTTLAFHDISYPKLPLVLEELKKIEFKQSMLVQNLSLLTFEKQGETLRETIPI
ncbi:MAG: hypothetical protein QF443_04930 [Dehalococcoidia bacterium]|nr:hypothetical protein [Dehalococcoidia bacterium]